MSKSASLNNKKEDILWISQLRAIATISVIILHVAAPFLYKFNETKQDWWIGNIYDSAVRFCVPIFVMITGALLLSKEITLSDFFKKRLTRILFPFIFWSLIYIFLDIFLRKYHGEIIPPNTVFQEIRDKFINGSSYHLWYVYMILVLYLCIPIINRWIKNVSENQLLYFIIIWFALIICSQAFISEYISTHKLIYYIEFIGYLVLGYYLSIKSFSHTKNLVFIPVILIMGGIAATIVGTYIASAKANKFDDILYGYMMPNVLVTAVGVFLFCKHKIVRNQYIIKSILFLNRYSYGIYLMHVVVLILFNLIGINGALIHPIVGIPLMTMICLTISASTIYVMHKLPFGKYMAG